MKLNKTVNFLSLNVHKTSSCYHVLFNTTNNKQSLSFLLFFFFFNEQDKFRVVFVTQRIVKHKVQKKKLIKKK